MIKHRGANNTENKIIVNTGVCFFASLLFFIFLFFVYSFGTKNDFIFTKNIQSVNDWNFVQAKHFSDIPKNKEEHIDTLSGLHLKDNNKYLRLSRKFEASDKIQYLLIIPYYNQFNVHMNNDSYFDNINSTDVFGKTNRQIVVIPQSDTDTTIDITMKVGFLPRIQFYNYDQPPSQLPLTLNGMFGFFLAILCTLVCAAALLFFSIQRIPQRSRLINLFAIGFLTSLFDIIDRWLFDHGFGNPQYFKISMSLFVLVGVVLLFEWIRLLNCSGNFSVLLLTVGVLGSAIAATSSYFPLSVWILHHAGIFFSLSVILVLVFALLFKKTDAKLHLGEFFGLSLLLISYSSYFLFFTFQTDYLTKALILAAFLILVLLETIRLHRCSKQKTEFSGDKKGLMLFKPENLGGIDTMLNVFLHDSSNLNHVRNISLYVYAICHNADMSKEQSRFVAKAAFLHDIGKLMIPYSTLSKEGSLTNEEYEQMKLHAQFGYDILYTEDDEFLKTAAIIAKQHHERYDGNGYYGLKGQNIHPYACITCIADVFDAITTKRHYKEAWSFEDGFNYIATNGDIYFSPQFVKAFVNCRDEIYRIYCETRK
jgi:Response regulator containing a CheY-like receiver domain and an HD-GYP domain